MNYDPYDGKQINFERTDRSGRWSPLQEQDEIPDPIWMVAIGVVMIAALIVAGLGFALEWSWA